MNIVYDPPEPPSIQTAQHVIGILRKFLNHLDIRGRETWGFAVYRTVYSPESDISFPQAIERLTQFVRLGLEHSVNALGIPHLELEKSQLIDKIMERFRLNVFEDQDQFDGCRAYQLAPHFTLHMAESELDLDDVHGVDAIFLYIDEECLKDIMAAPDCDRQVRLDDPPLTFPSVRAGDVSPEARHGRVPSSTTRVAWDLWYCYYELSDECNL